MICNALRFTVCVVVSVLHLTVALDQRIDVVDSFEAPSIDDTSRDLLSSVGAPDSATVFWQNTSPEISGCLHFPDVNARLFQACTAHERASKCENNTAGEVVIDFNECIGDACFARIDTNGVFCRLGPRRTHYFNGTQATGLKCGLPPHFASQIDEWAEPSWMASIGGRSNFHCMTALPNGTQMHWRFICVNDLPEIEMRIRMPVSFLSGYFQPQCIVRNHCGGPSIFTSNAICFERGKFDSIAEAPSTDDETEVLIELENADFSQAYVAQPLTILLFVLMMCFLTI
eukprot:g5767.t1